MSVNLSEQIMRRRAFLNIISCKKNKCKSRDIIKTKTKELLKVLSSSGIRGTKFISIYNFPAQ